MDGTYIQHGIRTLVNHQDKLDKPAEITENGWAKNMKLSDLFSDLGPLQEPIKVTAAPFNNFIFTSYFNSRKLYKHLTTLPGR